MTELLRVAVLILGGFALGLTVTVLVLYVKVYRMGVTTYVPPYHVPVIAGSHALLIVAFEAEILQHVIDDDPFAWWFSPIAAMAFALTIVALVQMLRSKRIRKFEADVQAHGRA